jgi:hypothetical protein
MNNKGVGPSLTVTIIAVFAFVIAISLIWTMTEDFNTDNGLTFDSQYSDIYDNISASTDDLQNISTGLSNTNIITAAISGISSSLGAFAIGMGAITLLLQLPTIVMNIITPIMSAFPGLGLLFTFILFAVIVYLSMKGVQALRGTLNEA